MWQYNYSDDYLAHYGVLGMKWGVRRTAAQLGNRIRGKRTQAKRKQSLAKARATREKNRKAAAKRQKLLDKGLLSPKKMTDAELKARIERLNLEKEFKKSMTDARGDGGKKYVTDILKKIGENTLTNLGTQAATHVIGEAINKAPGVSSSDTAKRIVDPQKGQSDKK